MAGIVRKDWGQRDGLGVGLERYHRIRKEIVYDKYPSMLRASIWLSLNHTKKLFYGSMNVARTVREFRNLFPHLILTREQIGVGLQWPRCDL